MHTFQAGLGRLHMPSRCIMCGVWPTAAPTTPWCAECDAKWVVPLNRCTQCARRLDLPATVCGECLSHPPSLDHCIAAVDYAFPWPPLIYTLKGSSGQAWGKPLATLMAKAWLSNPELLGTPKIWAPIPLHNQTLRSRGHNQSWSLLRGLIRSAAFGRADQSIVDLLERPRLNEVQHQLGRAERQRNMQFAFRFNERHRNVVESAIQKEAGLQVVLIDDVYTTGATLNAAARAIKAHWPVQVSALVFAHTPPR
ncbi:MAG: hypothetical protein RL357_1529 [Pseudomonadota bacterium]